MAKLGAYYSLCPLIENKSLLGIAEDAEKGMVVVTLSKNIAGRYKLSDQKQVCCWKTKEKFSSPVMYNRKLSKYVAVFNQSYIKLWDCDEDNLDKQKKYKFNQPIHSISLIDGDVFILFENGNIHLLSNILDSRKELVFKEILSKPEQIVDVLIVTVNDLITVGLIVKSIEEYYLYWTTYNSTKHQFVKTKLHRDSFHLRGYILHRVENSVHLLTLWSDGRIFSWPLEDLEETTFPGELFTVMQHISTKYDVSMLNLGQNYMAVFGANSNEEGALLLIYNIQFKVTQSRQSFKLFSNGSKLWAFENNLMLPVGQNLAVIPFYLETEQLAALVGSHKVIQSGTSNDTIIVEKFEMVSWDNKLKSRDLQIPEHLKLDMNDLLKQGLPESLVTQELLEIILKNQDLESLTSYINYFLDIPEKYLAKLIKYIILLDKNVFYNQSNHFSKLFPTDLQPVSRIELLDKVLCKRFSETLMLQCFHLELALTEIITLLNYICFLWSEDGHLLPSMNVVKSNAKLIEWCFVILDASYQKLLFSKDSSKKTVLYELNRLVEQHLSSFDELKFLSSILDYIKTKKSLNNGLGISNIKYCIEQTCFY